MWNSRRMGARCSAWSEQGRAPNREMAFQGEKFTIQYDPAYPSKYDSDEASSASKIIRRTIVVVGAVFAITVFLREFLGR
jgi:hypothetical protein